MEYIQPSSFPLLRRKARNDRPVEPHNQDEPPAAAAPPIKQESLATEASEVDVPYLQPFQSRPFKRRRWCRDSFSLQSMILYFILIASLLALQAQGAFVPFDNCLSSSVINSDPPVPLQWIPLFVNATFDKTSTTHNLRLTFYGNVTGQATTGELPPPNSPQWKNPDDPLGKIVDISPTNPNRTATTLFQKYDVLTYVPYDAPTEAFCDATVNTTCPIAPAFFANASNPYELPAFSVNHDFESSYAFTTITSTIRVESGDANKAVIACISVNITPRMSDTLTSVLAYCPLIVLIFVGLATIFVATLSPWGSLNPFKWTSNYGRDEDLLRLVTPGFGDCLQYIQFIVLSGALSLNYPGFFQPVVSNLSWSTLMFNESFVSGEHGTQSLVDGMYVVKSEYGLGRMSQLIGMARLDDIWTGMVIWALVMIGAVIILTQFGFLCQFLVRTATRGHKEDLIEKNWPFTVGHVVRIVCHFFLLPIISLSMFQLVVAGSSPKYVTALAAILIVFILAFLGWILRLILVTKPRSLPFDDVPTVLLYGPLYNTYSDDKARFALVPALLTFVRGIAIGAVQASGVVQIVILAICEIVIILCLYAFRPFHKPTSMNIYHASLAFCRLAVVLMCIAFVPQLGVAESSKGWIGYAILLIHGMVLVFAFFFNSIMKLFEVTARLMGAGGDETTGAVTRGGLRKVFGVRQLSRRAKRPGLRGSMTSDAAMLGVEDDDVKSTHLGSRTRSMSASSAILLNQRSNPNSRQSGYFDQNSNLDVDPETPLEQRGYSVLPSDKTAGAGAGKPKIGLRTAEPADPYYRAPRQRRLTGELMTPGARSRGSNASELTPKTVPDKVAESVAGRESPGPKRPFSPSLGTPSAAFMRSREDSETNINDPRRADVDYAVREVDFYYGVRGPALSSVPNRKRKTGPTDPVGPVSSATGWFKGLFGRQRKDSSKGFEVVRSSRAIPPELLDEEQAQSAPESYHDSPQSQTEAYIPGQRTRSTDGESEQPGNIRGGRDVDDDLNSLDSEDEATAYEGSGGASHLSAPYLNPIETVGSIELPSRFNSNRTDRSRRTARSTGPPPNIPLRSSRRNISRGEGSSPLPPPPRLSTVTDASSRAASSSPQPRLPFSGSLTPHGGTMRSMDPESDISADEEIQVASVARGFQRQPASNQEVPTPPRSRGEEGRPTSMGMVNQYRTSDSTYSNFQGPIHEGSSAEVVSAPQRRSRGSTPSLTFTEMTDPNLP